VCSTVLHTSIYDDNTETIDPFIALRNQVQRSIYNEIRGITYPYHITEEKNEKNINNCNK
jgi:hypothetical protein